MEELQEPLDEKTIKTQDLVNVKRNLATRFNKFETLSFLIFDISVL